MLLVIQGIADVEGRTSQAEVSKAVDFTFNAVQRNNPEEHGAVLQKPNGPNGNASDPTDPKAKEWVDVVKDALSTDEQRVLKMVKDTFQDYFTVDAFDGMVANLKRGSLGLVKAAPADQADKKQPVIEHHFEKQPVVEHKFVADALHA